MEKFCTACQSRRAEEGGEVRKLRGTTRWLCKDCKERKTPSIYKNTSGRPADVRYIMDKLQAK